MNNITEYIEVELHVIVDADGGCEADTDLDCALERFQDNCEGAPVRTMTLKIRVPKPEVITITLADAPVTVIA